MRSNGNHNNVLVRIRELSKQYVENDAKSIVLDRVNLDVATGDFVVLLGASGSGKSTLLNLISGVDNPTGGHVEIDGVRITSLPEPQRTLVRRDKVGIVFQFFNLIPTLTVLENVTLPLELQGLRSAECARRGRDLLERVGLADKAREYPERLSGGEQQRVAIARALIHRPSLVLADEPTGNLDEETGRLVIDLLLRLTRDAGKTLIMATHDPTILPLADRVCRISEGKLKEEPVTHPLGSLTGIN